MKRHSIDNWLSQELIAIKSANLHRNLVEISSPMGPEIEINNEKWQ